MKPNGPLRVRLVSFYTLKSYIIVKPLHYLIYKKSTSTQHGTGDKILPNGNKIYYVLGLRGYISSNGGPWLKC